MSSPSSDWIVIPITFRAKCQICNKEVPPGRVFWSQSLKAAIHLGCMEKQKQQQAQQMIPSSYLVAPKAIESEIKKPLTNDDTTTANHDSVSSPVNDFMHSGTDKIKELICFICGSVTGCGSCAFLDNCNVREELEYCICETCSGSTTGDVQDRKNISYEAYQRAFLKQIRKLST